MIENDIENFTAAIEVSKGKYVYFTSREELQAWLKKEYDKDYTHEDIDVILNKPRMQNIIDDMLDLYF
jgi:hypothetical protein